MGRWRKKAESSNLAAADVTDGSRSQRVRWAWYETEGANAELGARRVVWAYDTTAEELELCAAGVLGAERN